MRRALLIRQKEECVSLTKILAEKGIDSYCCPLFTPHFFTFPLLKDPQGLIITSKNSLRALEGREELKTLPLYVVGDQTAQFARKKGFLKVFSASGTSQELIRLILQKASYEKGILWHLSGDVTKGNIVETLQTEGFHAKRHIVYSLKEEEDLSSSFLCDLQNQKISHVLFFSPRTTTIFIHLLKKNGLEDVASRMTALCLSQNVVEMTHTLVWKKVWRSPKANVQDMIGYFNEK